jgi:hypothetical protein
VQLREQGVTLEQLKIEHDMIDQHASDLIGMACGSSGGHTAASATLASLADLVASHLEKENVLVYAIVAKVRGSSAEEAWAAVTAFDALKADWQAYLVEWTSDRVASRWAEFQRDTIAILRRLNARVREERQSL